MQNELVQQIKDELSKNGNVAIVLGKNPTVDEMAAGLSLFLLLNEVNKKVTIACPTEPIVELSNLVGIDKVTNKLDGQSGDLVVSFPYVEGEIEKVSYTLEKGFLNIIVKASGNSLSFDEKDLKYTKGGENPSLLFVIGAPNIADLGDIISSDKLRDTKIINIDNKQENQGYGDIVVVSTNYSSVSEQIADLVLSLGLRLDKDVAQNLLSGITYATKNFQEVSTSPLAFEIASLLMRSGAHRQSIAANSRQIHKLTGEELRHQVKPENKRSRFPVIDDQDSQSKQDEQLAPNDWLNPKVYKGSSNF